MYEILAKVPSEFWGWAGVFSGPVIAHFFMKKWLPENDEEEQTMSEEDV